MSRARRSRLKMGLPFTNWPADHQKAFNTSHDTEPNRFVLGSPVRRLRSRTINARRAAVGRFLGYLASEAPQTLSCPLAQSLTHQSLIRFCELLEKSNNSVSLATNIGFLYLAARRMEPDHDWDWLRQLLRRLESVASPNPRNAIPLTSAQLVDIGLAQMADAETSWANSSRAAPHTDLCLRYRDGLLICFLGLLPLRNSNVRDLRLGGSGPLGGDWQVSNTCAQTKNNHPIEVDLPGWLSEKIYRFVEHFRPGIGPARKSEWLFCSRQATRLSVSGLERAFHRSLMKRAGVDLPPHGARRVAATTIALADPANVSVASDLLGHRSRRVTEAHYNMAGSARATAALIQVVQSLREPKSCTLSRRKQGFESPRERQ
jgi:hypothetical protein